MKIAIICGLMVFGATLSASAQTTTLAEGYLVSTNAHKVSLVNSTTNDLLYKIWIGGVAE